MKEYQSKRNNPYYLPHDLYMQVIYAIRGYDRLKRERGDILAGNRSADDGMPKSPTPGDPVAEKATKLAAISSKIDAIDRAIARVPQEYRQGVLDNVMYRDRWPVSSPAHLNTWSKWRTRFIFWTAQNLNLI